MQDDIVILAGIMVVIIVFGMLSAGMDRITKRRVQRRRERQKRESPSS